MRIAGITSLTVLMLLLPLRPIIRINGGGGNGRSPGFQSHWSPKPAASAWLTLKRPEHGERPLFVLKDVVRKDVDDRRLLELRDTGDVLAVQMDVPMQEITRFEQPHEGEKAFKACVSQV